MKREIEIWWKQSERDFSNAKKNFDIGEYYLTAFLVQQSVEKALKSYFIFKKEDYSDKTHSLIYLGSELKLPNELLLNLRKINPDFIYTRYPDAKIILFGSRARGDNLKSSDFDFIVISDSFKGIKMPNRFEVYECFEDLYNVDILPYTFDEFEKQSKLLSITKKAKEEGIYI